MSVTDEDRAKAIELQMEQWGITFDDWTDRISAALAEEREKARAPFRDLAEWLDVTDDPFRDDPSYIAAIIRIALAKESE